MSQPCSSLFSVNKISGPLFGPFKLEHSRKASILNRRDDHRKQNMYQFIRAHRYCFMMDLTY